MSVYGEGGWFDECVCRICGILDENCYALFVYWSTAGPKKVLFRPADGILRVGSSESIECILDVNESVVVQGTFELQDMQARGDLLSTDNQARPVVIRPPEGEETYPKPGSTFVRCMWEQSGTGQKAERNLTVRILREFLSMRLNANEFSSDLFAGCASVLVLFVLFISYIPTCVYGNVFVSAYWYVFRGPFMISMLVCVTMLVMFVECIRCLVLLDSFEYDGNGGWEQQWGSNSADWVRQGTGMRLAPIGPCC